MKVNKVDRQRQRVRAPASALYVIAGLAAVLLAAVMLHLGQGGVGLEAAAVTSIPVGWLMLSPLARLARRRGGRA